MAQEQKLLPQIHHQGLKKKNKYLNSFFTSAKQLAVDELVMKKVYIGGLNPLHFL